MHEIRRREPWNCSQIFVSDAHDLMDRSNAPPFWTVSLGRWAGADIRLHAAVIFFVLAACFFGAEENQLFVGCAFAFSAACASLIRESARWFVRAKLYRRDDMLVVSPLGTPIRDAASIPPASLAAISAAGPAANLAAATIAVGALLVANDPLAFALDPDAVWIGSGPWSSDAVRVFALVNAVLGVVHLLPAAPLDGGPLLGALLQMRFGLGRSTRIGVLFARGVTLCLLVAAFAVWRLSPDAALAGLGLGMLGVFLAFSTRRAQAAAEPPQLEQRELDSVAHPSAESRVDCSTPWSDGRRAVARERVAAAAEADQESAAISEADDERRLDAILASWPEGGINELSDEDRALLERASLRRRTFPKR